MQNPDVRILQLPVDPTRPRLCVGVQKLRFLILTIQSFLESRPLKLRAYKLTHAFLPSYTRLSHRLLDVGRPVRPQQPVDFGGAYGPNGLINRLQIFTGASSTSTLSIPKWTSSGSSSFGYTVRLRVRKHSRRRPVRDAVFSVGQLVAPHPIYVPSESRRRSSNGLETTTSTVERLSVIYVFLPRFSPITLTRSNPHW